MNFLQFLKKSTNEPVIEQSIIKYSNIEQSTERTESTEQSTEHIEQLQLNSEPQSQINTEFIKYKKGNFIRIIYLENSPLNHYKGYNGEIRMYTFGCDHANIMLEAINSNMFIKFPIKHFQLI
jgi:hypothetical protein